MKRLEKLTLKKFDSDSVKTMSNHQMNHIRGGQYAHITLHTTTVTPNGAKCDGWDMEIPDDYVAYCPDCMKKTPYTFYGYTW